MQQKGSKEGTSGLWFFLLSRQDRKASEPCCYWQGQGNFVHQALLHSVGEKVFWKMVALNGAVGKPLLRVPRRITPTGWTRPLWFALSSAHLKVVGETRKQEGVQECSEIVSFSTVALTLSWWHVSAGGWPEHVCRRMTKDSSLELKGWWFWVLRATTHMGLHPFEGRQGAKVHLTPTAEKRARKP